MSHGESTPAVIDVTPSRFCTTIRQTNRVNTKLVALLSCAAFCNNPGASYWKQQRGFA
jgi:hypothetical protein